ncbi:Fic/DOC family N-terminal domain-containing protein [Filomicrobium sp.]|uniref:Fic family protein n=1 Tax=Filomicrobium sp. TaxID=2024831 RepID=UPI00259010E1|nr:Fic/DOC family N-terminal domain-containing protein [Filomicrobium sp.]MCV0370543.1 Fic family protein [Filomicrobium sp.]
MLATPEFASPPRPVIPQAVELETRSILKKCVAARTALADLRYAGKTFSDPAACASTFALLEAKDSCQIANVVTAIDPLFKAANGLRVKDDDATRQILRCRAALIAAAAASKYQRLSIVTAATLAHALTLEAGFTPPSENRLTHLLADWARFQTESEDIDPLVHLAVSHYLFTSAQPFALATGPAARILTLMSLLNTGLIDLPVLYLSRHLLATKGSYDRSLAKVTETGEWEPFLDYMLTAIEQSAIWTNGKLRATRAMIDMTADHIKTYAPKIYSPELAELIFIEPYTRIQHLGRSGIAKRQTAAVYLKQLAAIGILKEHKVGRSKIFIHRKYLYLMARDENTFTPYPPPTLG